MGSKITPNNINPSCPNCGVHHTGRCKLFKRQSPEDDIIWSETSYTLQDMNELFADNAPYIAKVDLGDFGDTEASTIEIGQVLRIAKHYDQPRVIATSESGSVTSIPLSLPLKFSPVRQKSNNLTAKFTDTVKGLSDTIRLGKVFSRGKMLSEYTKKLPTTVELCENAYADDVMNKGSFSYDDIRQLTLTKLHKYSYLVCNEVTGGTLNPENTLLMPTFLRMKLRISTGRLKDDSTFSTEQLQQMQDSLTECSSTLDFNEILEPQEIFHYEGIYNKNTMYERLAPTEYVQHMYTRSRHPLIALVSSHGHRMMQKVWKAFNSTKQTSTPSQPDVLQDDEGIYETIELTKDRKPSIFQKHKPKVPPKTRRPSDTSRSESHENTYDIDESGPVHPNLIGKRYVNAQAGPSHDVQAELAARFKRSISHYQAYDDITKLTVMEVGDILAKLNLRKYKLKFLHRQIDGNILKDLVSDVNFDFKTQFEMDDIEERKLKKCVNENWLPNL